MNPKTLQEVTLYPNGEPTLQAVIDAAYDALSEAFLIVDTVEFNTAIDEVRGMLAAYRS